MPDLAFSIQNEQTSAIDLAEIEAIAQLVWNTEAHKHAEINVILVDDKRLTQINMEFLNKDYQTDVIAFPLSDEDEEEFEGEVYISLDRIIDNAGFYDVAPSFELKRIVVHALLHFLGYSDKDEIAKKKMTAREDFYLEQFP